MGGQLYSTKSRPLRIYEFSYDFKHGTVSYLAGDTENFVLKVSGLNDVDRILKANQHLLDCSNLPDGHYLKMTQIEWFLGK